MAKPSLRAVGVQLDVRLVLFHNALAIAESTT